MITRRSALGLLAAAATASLVGCSSPAPASSAAASGAVAQGPETLDAAGFAALVARPGTVVLDVRTPAEYAEAHLANAVNIDVNASDFATRVAQLDKTKTYAVYCRSGNRSATALGIMKKAGFTQVQHLGGGISAWTSAGHPVVR